MSKITIAFLAFVGIVFLGVIVVIGSYVSNANYGNRAEQSIQARYTDNQNIYSNYGQKIMEMAEIPSEYSDKVKDIAKTAIESRYGDSGSKAMLQFIKEQNPTLDPSMYKNIQNEIVAGRNEFQTAQTTLVDQERQYKTKLGNVYSGFWLHAAGYPKIDLAKYQPVTTDRASTAFSTGKEAAPLQIFPKQQ